MKATTAFRVLPLAILLSVTSAKVAAQGQGEDVDLDDMSIFEEVVVTGVARGTVKLDTSISISSMDYNQVNKFSPRGIAELLEPVEVAIGEDEDVLVDPLAATHRQERCDDLGVALREELLGGRAYLFRRLVRSHRALPSSLFVE